MRVTIFDYGAGNLHSLAKALAVPGVGNFTVAAERLAPARGEVRDAIRAGLPTLGVCLGMQLLFDRSDEGTGEGLGVIPGCVTRLRAERVPQIGWNTVECETDDLFAAAPLDIAYYANGFVCRPADPSCVVAWTTHGNDRFPAAVRSGRALGVQFHPEKSSAAGVRFLRAFLTGLGA